MSGSLLIAGAGSPPRVPTFAQRLFMRGFVERLRGLCAGAIRLTSDDGTQVFGNPGGPLGTIDLFVHDPAFWSHVAFSGDVGAGESYVAGNWSTPDLVGLLRLFVRDREVLLDVDRSLWSLPRRWLLRLGHWWRDNSLAGSRRNIAAHYDLGDALFAHFLDPTMTYSSAWFEHEGQSLEAAQRAKLSRLCRLVDLQPGERLLEIGTGWGSLAAAAAGDFGAHVTTTTISARQLEGARARVAAAGLHDRVELLQRDYRDLTGTFDKVLSCEMVEAVGAGNLPTYLRTCAARLRPGGLLGLQAITIQDQHYESALHSVDYIKRHVFPGSFIPSVTALVGTAARAGLQVDRFEDFGPHYATTLSRWRQAVLGDPGPFVRRGGPALVRAWEYYFAYCESGFHERHIGVCQLRFRRQELTS